MAALLGLVSQATANYNNTVDGTILPTGAPVMRNFKNTEGEMYAQDSWRIKNNLTVTYGLRYSLMPPVHEANGQQVSTNIPIGTWFNQRGALAGQGLPQRHVHHRPVLSLRGNHQLCAREQPDRQAVIPVPQERGSPLVDCIFAKGR